MIEKNMRQMTMDKKALNRTTLEKSQRYKIMRYLNLKSSKSALYKLQISFLVSLLPTFLDHIIVLVYI